MPTSANTGVLTLGTTVTSLRKPIPSKVLIECQMKRRDLLVHSSDPWAPLLAVIDKSSRRVVKKLGENQEKEVNKRKAKKTIAAILDEPRLEHIRRLTVQGRLTEIKEVSEWDGEWSRVVWNLPSQLLRFVVNAAGNTLPTDDNLARWQRPKVPCGLCGSADTIVHTLAGCKIALEQGRYTWRHDSILLKLYTSFAQAVGFNNWIGLWANPKKPPYPLPPCFPPTPQQPDIIFYKPDTRQVCLIELTAGCEENREQGYEYKQNRYAELCAFAEMKGWTVLQYSIHVGARGVLCKRLSELMAFAKIKGTAAKNLRTELRQTAIACSYCIWIHRKQMNWPNFALV